MENKDNLPTKSENSLIKKKELPGVLAKVENDFLKATIESLIPKIQPLIDPAIEKTSEYLGQNEKIVVLRQLPGQSPMAIVLENNKGSYTISCNGNGEEKIFSASPDSVISVINMAEFIKQLLAGEVFSK